VRRVPWRLEDLYELFAGPCFNVNARSTVSRTGVGLAHVLIGVLNGGGTSRALEENVRKVWQQMKGRTTQELVDLNASRDESKHIELRHSLIVNANLDLNKPA
jgi:hypothetical protein